MTVLKFKNEILEVVNKLDKKKLEDKKYIPESIGSMKAIINLIELLNRRDYLNAFSVDEENLNEYLGKLNKSVEDFYADPSEDNACEIRNSTRPLFVLFSFDVFVGLGKVIEYGDSLKYAIEEANSDIEKFNTDSKERLNALDGLKENYEVELNIFKKNYSSAIEDAKYEFETTMTAFKAKLATKLAEVSAINAKQVKLFDEFYENALKKNKQLVNDSETFFDEKKEQLKIRLEDVKEYIEGEKKQVSGFFEFSKSLVDSGSFNMAALKEGRNADRFRIVAIIFMIIVVLIMVTLTFNLFDVLNQGNGEINPLTITLRFVLVFTLMIPAAYASRESNRHRSNAELYTMVASEMAAIQSYVGKMPEEKQIEIREKLADKYFGHFRLIGSHKNIGATEEILSLIDSLRDLVRKDEKNKSNEPKSGTSNSNI